MQEPLAHPAEQQPPGTEACNDRYRQERRQPKIGRIDPTGDQERTDRKDGADSVDHAQRRPDGRPVLMGEDNS